MRLSVQADVVKLIQSAENIYVAYLGDSSYEQKTDIFVAVFEWAVETSELLTVLFFGICIKGIENWLVVFID